ncbi:MAG: CsgG/HfaB family protein [Burkholderiaceae bacterium]
MKTKAVRTSSFGLALACVLLITGCATESQRVIETPQPTMAQSSYSGPKSTIALGQFGNSSPFMRGIFTDGQNRLGNQAQTILKTHLSQTNRFFVLDRSNNAQLAAESKLSGKASAIEGASLILTGDVTEFGRKATGDKQLFGLLGRGKKQIAYSKVSLNVVDVQTSRIIFSAQGAGEYELSNREILGTGGTASYDATLNGKVLDLSIRQAVANLVAGLEAGQWQAASQ